MQMIDELDELLKHNQETKENKISFLETIDLDSKYSVYFYLTNNYRIN